MTLQQKLLAKKSKKGFTLVELVVVIAILAILAAIAIPMVVNIINSANQSSGETAISEINSEVKNFYSSIVSGAIDANGVAKGQAGYAGKTSSSGRTADAKAATVADALKWAGLNGTYSTDADLTDFYYDMTASNGGGGTGNMQYVNTAEGQTVPNGYTQLKTTTPLGDIYEN